MLPPPFLTEYSEPPKSLDSIRFTDRTPDVLPGREEGEGPTRVYRLIPVHTPETSTLGDWYDSVWVTRDRRPDRVRVWD